MVTRRKYAEKMMKSAAIVQVLNLNNLHAATNLNASIALNYTKSMTKTTRYTLEIQAKSRVSRFWPT